MYRRHKHASELEEWRACGASQSMCDTFLRDATRCVLRRRRVYTRRLRFPPLHPRSAGDACALKDSNAKPVYTRAMLPPRRWARQAASPSQ